MNRFLTKVMMVLAVVAVMFGHAEQVSALTFTGLVAYYPGEGNANDASGNGNNGTLVGGTSFAAGQVGQAFSFDGVDSYVDASLSQSLSVYTIAAFAKPSAITVGAAVVGDGNNFFPFLQIGGSNEWQFNGAFNSGFTAQVGKLDFLTGIQTVSTQELYVNGVLVKSVTGTSILTSVNIGRRSDNVFFNGLIDEVQIYNRALSGAEILALSNVPEPSTMLLLGSGLAGLVAWRMRKAKA